MFDSRCYLAAVVFDWKQHILNIQDVLFSKLGR